MFQFPYTFIYPPKVTPGAKVAIVSPSSGLPEIFPQVFELGLQRLQQNFGLIPVEYPTTRQMHAPLEARARDLHAAFTDPEIQAVICSIGGDDQIKLIKYLDPEIFRAHPKPFLGYSDNTNLHTFLWNQGLVSYYGGSIMVHFGRGGAMHPYTTASLRHTLFEHGEFEILPPPDFTDETGDWADPQNLLHEPTMFPNSEWLWHNAEQVIEGRTWGGDLEILDWQLTVGHSIQPNEVYKDAILLLETDEEMPTATAVYRILMCMGERGLLQQFAAVLVARPKAWSFEQPLVADAKVRFISEQREAILNALNEYHPNVLTVFNLDFGHTDPQLILPSGGHVRIDGPARRLYATY